ncbi:MAG: aquaporin [Thaumarchaeota archaeon]|nr:aquaporin [Nitrososphaerota archaeon]
MTCSQKKFLAEMAGTFVVVALATGSVVISARYGGVFGPWFVALAPAAAVAMMVYSFGRVSMAHFNPAVSVGFLITKHLPRNLLPVYLGAEMTGAILASVFVRYAIGTQADLGANAPDYHYPILLIIGVEVLATGLLMAVILAVVHTGGLRGLGGIAIGGIVGLDIFFLGVVSGASMNPARSLAPALLSDSLGSLWLYLTATFIGSGIVAAAYSKCIGK